MAQIVRAAIDYQVEGPKANEVAKAFQQIAQDAANHAVNVLIAALDDPALEGVKIKPVAAGAHVHSTDSGYCDMCDRYSRREVLVEFE